MFLFIIIFLVAIVLWIVSIIFNDIEDGLQYCHGESIFDWLPKDGWWSWYMEDPDDTWKRKYKWDEDGNNMGRKKWMGFPIPAFVFDGWHGVKIARQLFQYLTYFTGVIGGYVLVTLTFPGWFLLFVSALVVFGITNYLTHEVYVFKGLILKEWWIEKGKEEIIKKFLDKWF